MTGLRVETVIRTMRLMHEKGELVISKGKVYCKDMIEVIAT
jgi:CRP/FNR family cyclic AMP-dependent transcriptional regulator